MFCAAAEAVSDRADQVGLKPLLNVYDMATVSTRLTPGKPRVNAGGLLHGQGHIVLACSNQEAIINTILILFLFLFSLKIYLRAPQWQAAGCQDAEDKERISASASCRWSLNRQWANHK